MTEEWRPIPGYQGFYDVSSCGRVRGLDRLVPCGRGMRLIRGRVLALRLDADGYPRVTLSKGGRHRRFGVHCLVAAAFIGQCPPGREVCHRNGQHQDNRPANLYHGTRSQNIHDQVRHGTHRNARKRWCGSCGGPYDTVNTRGERVCRACAARHARAYRARRRAAA